MNQKIAPKDLEQLESSFGYKTSAEDVGTQFTTEQIINAQARAKNVFSSKPGYSGSAVLFDVHEGREPTNPKVHIFFEDESALEGAVAEAIVPNTIEGLPVVIEQKKFKASDLSSEFPKSPKVTALPETLVHRKMRCDPFQPGISIAHKDSTAGTLGLIVIDNLSMKKAVLSNWHVLASTSAAKPGDAIIQPGPFDGGREGVDTIATLERMMLDSQGDAAIAILNGQRKLSEEIYETNVKLAGVRLPKVGELLTKSGRTTGVTVGVVKGFGSVVIGYEVGRKEINGFYIIPRQANNPNNEEISSGGDSGSIWYGNDRQGVGLHFAGESDARPEEEHAIACLLPKVFERLNISLPISLPKNEIAQPAVEKNSLIMQLAEVLGDGTIGSITSNYTPAQLKQYADDIVRKNPWMKELSDSGTDEVAYPDFDPFCAVALGFATGAAARLIGKSKESLSEVAVDVFPAAISAFLAGVIAGAHTVDGKNQ